MPGAQDDPNLQMLQKLSFGFVVMQPLALGLTKTSVLFFYRRVFTGQAFNLTSWTLLGVTAIWSVGLWLASLLQCGSNTTDFWRQTSNSGQCRALSISGTFIVTDIVLDLAVAAVPVPFVRSQRLDSKKPDSILIEPLGHAAADAIEEEADGVCRVLFGQSVSIALTKAEVPY